MVGSGRVPLTELSSEKMRQEQMEKIVETRFMKFRETVSDISGKYFDESARIIFKKLN